jgi:PAS domain S-box-containing protein
MSSSNKSKDELLEEIESLKVIFDKNIKESRRVEQELILALKEIAFQNEEKGKRAAELIIANLELAFQNEEKSKRAAELIIANLDLAFQNEEKEKRAAELIIANEELAFQVIEKAKRAEELITVYKSLVDSEARYRNLFDSARDGILILDSDTGRIIDVNQFLSEMLGILKENFLEKTIWEIGFFQNIIDSKDKLLELKQKRFTQFEGIPINHDFGRRLEVEFVSNIFFNRGKEFISCVIRDITERKRDKTALIESKNLLTNILESIHDAFFALDDEFVVTYFNNAAEIFLHQKRDDVIGRNLFEVFPEARGSVFEANCLKANQEKIFMTFEEFFGIEPYKEWYDVRIYPQEKGISVYFLITTERKKAEEALFIQKEKIELQNYEYEVLNEDLTETNKALIIAKEHAEESDKLKTAFLQNMSHEIRTPLNGIIGFSGLLNNENLSKDEIKEFSTNIKQSGNRLIEIVNNVLDMSKIETGQAHNVNKPIFINDVFSDLLTFFSRSAEAKNICLNYHNPEDKYISIYSDEAKLNQILANLINNSIKFTKTGRIDFGYEIKSQPSEGFKPSEGSAVIQFYVKDTGIGIDLEFYNRIFVRFSQVESSVGRNYEGAGLGLAICKGLVELLGGKIWFESEINKGTTFFFTLPYKPVESTSESIAKTSELLVKSITGKILIAEDDLLSFIFLNSLLSKSGYIVIHAENGKEAVEMVKTTTDIDLILMDVRMPVMDGMEATRQIKLIRPELPIIAQTAFAYPDEINNILAGGCIDYINKPVEKEKLNILLDKYLK